MRRKKEKEMRESNIVEVKVEENLDMEMVEEAQISWATIITKERTLQNDVVDDTQAVKISSSML